MRVPSVGGACAFGCAWGIVLITLAMSSAVNAGGYEFPGDGARAIGRGGAFAAQADDPMAIVVNPANLASLPGTQLMFTTHLLFARDCFNRNVDGAAPDGTPTPPAWNPEWGTNANSNNPDGSINYTEVCNQRRKRLTVIPAIGVTWRVSKRLGMGFAIIPPNSEREQLWGDSQYNVTTDNGSQRRYDGYVGAPPGSTGGSIAPGGRNALVPLNNGQNLLPASSRFLLVERDIVVVLPTFAVGAKPLRWLQIGAAFGWGIADVTFTNNLRTVTAGEAPNILEGQAKLEGQDWFAPRVSASIHFIPYDNLDLVGVFRWDDTIRAKGDLTAGVPAFDNGPGLTGLNSLVGKGTIIAPRPWWVTVEIRYADRIVPRPDDADAPGRVSGKVEDPMLNERWDIEVDFVYEKSSVVDNLAVQIENLDAEQGSPLIQQPINVDLEIGHHWQDQISLRVGSDWNVPPGVLALRGGFSTKRAASPALAARPARVARSTSCRASASVSISVSPDGSSDSSYRERSAISG